MMGATPNLADDPEVRAAAWKILADFLADRTEFSDRTPAFLATVLDIGAVRALVASHAASQHAADQRQVVGDLPVVTRATAYQVIPEGLLGDDEAHGWTIGVSRTMDGQWVAVRGSGFHFGPTDVLAADGTWHWDPHRPLHKRFLHDLPTALRLAREAMPAVRCNGLTPAGVIAWKAARRAERDAAQ